MLFQKNGILGERIYTSLDEISDDDIWSGGLGATDMMEAVATF